MFVPQTSIDAPYDELAFIHNLPVYNTCVGTDEMLDLIREIQTSGNYYWQGVAIPSSDKTLIPAMQTVNGTVQIPEGSYITAINFFINPEGLVIPSAPEGYKIKIYDKGTKASIFYGDYALARTVGSDMQVQYGVGTNNPPSDPGSNLDDPFGQGYLMNPFIITNPGVLGWEIVNLSAVDAVIQLMLCVAVPINKRTVGHTTVSKG
jgi:hypothetical protein